MKQQDAIALLKADHKAVKALFSQSEELSDRAKVQLKRLGDQICAELTVHAQIEEQIFYPTVKERAGRKNKDEYDLVLESVEEHALVKHVIADLEDLDAADESYKPKLKVLKEIVQQHVKEEEREMFPGVRDLMDEEELIELGRQMLQLKTRLQRKTATA